jgi:S-adenosylmethionine-diacylglycerol 3-amino-3-carboxypropyl transferase
MLDASARRFWDERDFRGRPRYGYFTDGFYRHGALGHFIGFAHRLAKLARIDLAALLSEKRDSPARLKALDRLHRLFHSPLARLITKTPALLFSLGIPPQQRSLLGGDAPLNQVLHQRLLRLIDVYPNETNYFAWQALQRRYVGPQDQCLPLYLQKRQFERMRAGAGLIIPVHANLRVFLESLPARQIDAVVRAGKDTVRVIFRTAGTASPLESPELGALQQTWRRDTERSAIGFDRDRSGIYGGFHCYARR